MLIKPILQGNAFLDDVHNSEPQPGFLKMWWLGQSGFLLKYGSSHLLLDPYLSDSLTKKYENTDKPHVRMTEKVIAPQLLNFIDGVTSSHNHTDHLDHETLNPLLLVNPALTLIVPCANVKFAADRLKIPNERITPIRTEAEPITLGPFKIHAIPSAHETLQTDDQGNHKFVGYVIEAAGKSIYHSGDACPYEGLVESLGKWKIDLAMLPINGRDPARGVAGNFTATEAVDLARDIQARMVIPCHYEMFKFNSVSPESFAHYARTNGIPHRVLSCGEGMTI